MSLDKNLNNPLDSLNLAKKNVDKKSVDEKLEQFIDMALAEDLRSGDITSQACISDQEVATARIVLKQAGVIAALPYLYCLFQKIDPRIEVTFLVEEGSYQKAGAILVKIAGPARGILSGERTALNIFQHASGIATITAAYVKKAAPYKCAILDTRRTLPGLRSLEKYAVKMGGGVNNRFGLDDRFIIKRNHLAFLSHSKTHPIQVAVEKALAHRPHVDIEIEIDNMALLSETLQTPATVIILCKMSPYEVARCVEKIRKTNKKIYVDSSGTITLDTIRSYAELGVDAISIGALTHSVKALEMSLKM